MVKKTAAFLVERNTYFRYLSPFIDALLARGVEIHLIQSYEGDRFNSTKFQEFPMLSQSPFTREPGVSHHAAFTKREMGEQARRLGVQYVFGIHSRTQYQLGPDWPEKGRYFCVMNGVNHLNTNSFHPPDVTLDTVPGWSSQWKDLLIQNHDSIQKARLRWEPTGGISERPDLLQQVEFVETGFPALEKAQTEDPRKIAEKYHLDPDRPVVLYFPRSLSQAYLSSRRTFYRMRLYQKLKLDHNYHISEVVRSLRTFCDRYGWQLVVKGRSKFEVAESVRDMVDRLWYEETTFPSTSMELLHLARVSVDHFSGPTFESWLAGNFCMHIDVPGAGFGAYFRGLLGDRWEELMDQPGVGKPLQLAELSPWLESQNDSDLKGNPDLLGAIRNEFCRGKLENFLDQLYP